MEISKQDSLAPIWAARCSLINAGCLLQGGEEGLNHAARKLRSIGGGLWDAGKKLSAAGQVDAGEKFKENGSALRIKSHNFNTQKRRLIKAAAELRAQGVKLWDDAVLKICGPVKMEWSGGCCRLETGEEFKS